MSLWGGCGWEEGFKRWGSGREEIRECGVEEEGVGESWERLLEREEEKESSERG